MRDSLRQDLYLHIVKHEHHYAIVGIALLIATVFFQQLGVFSLFAITVIVTWGVIINPDAISFSHGFFSGFPSILLRYTVVSFFSTVFILYYPIHGITTQDIVHLGLLITWFIGYFMAFMKRKNFSAWITLLFPAVLLSTAVFFSNIAVNSDISLIFALSIFAATIRFVSHNVLDALSVFIFGLLVRFTVLSIL